MAGPDEQRIKIMDRQKNLLNGHLSFRAAPLSNVSEEEVATTGWRRGPRCVDAAPFGSEEIHLGKVVARNKRGKYSLTSKVGQGQSQTLKTVSTDSRPAHLNASAELRRARAPAIARDRHRIGVGLQRLKFIQHGLSQGNWVLSHRLPSSPGLGANEFGRMARRAPCIA